MKKKVVLTKKKEKWVKQFKPSTLQGTPIQANRAIEQKTIAKTEKLVEKMTKEVNRELIKLFKQEAPEYFAQDASITSQARILLNALTKKFTKMFDLEGAQLMGQMVMDVDKNNQLTVKESLKALAGVAINTKDLSAETKEMIKAGAQQASTYIKSIAQEYLTDVAGATYRSITEGKGLKDLIPALEKYEGMTKRRAKNIALDQTRKTNSALGQARMKQAGITKFKWMHSGGSKDPRETHQEFDGQIFSFDDLPYDKDAKQRVYPGQLPYCRCTAIPVIEFEDEKSD